MSRAKGFVLLAIAVTLMGCAQQALTIQELAQYQAILDRGLPPLQLKEPALAGVLNLACGGGYFYLEEWGHGLLNLVLCPISWIWGIPAGFTDARRQNVRYTLEYYKRQDIENPR
jgi:hypothetical protein